MFMKNQICFNPIGILFLYWISRRHDWQMKSNRPVVSNHELKQQHDILSISLNHPNR